MSSCSIFEMKTKWPSLANPLSPSPSLLHSLASSAKRLEFVCQPFAAAATVATRRPPPINGLDWRAETTSQKPCWEWETRSQRMWRASSRVQLRFCHLQHATCGNIGNKLQQYMRHLYKTLQQPLLTRCEIGVFGHFCFCPKKKVSDCQSIIPADTL